MQKETHNLATLIYLDLEVECDGCHKRPVEPEGGTETEVWQWVDRTAAAA